MRTNSPPFKCLAANDALYVAPNRPKDNKARNSQPAPTIKQI